MKPGLSIRLNLARGARFGPGKASLLTAIRQHGSISGAAKSLGMSYPRALKLIEEMNADFTLPLVSSSHGGAEKGGSEITETGQAVLNLYADACARAGEAANDALQSILRLQER